MISSVFHWHVIIKFLKQLLNFLLFRNMHVNKSIKDWVGMINTKFRTVFTLRGREGEEGSFIWDEYLKALNWIGSVLFLNW